MAAKHWIAVVLGVAVLGANACSSGPTDLGEMRVQRDGGKVQILRGSDVIDVGDVASIEPKDIVITGANGSAHLNLETTDQSVVLAPGTHLRIRSTTSVEGQKGSLVATASGAPMHVTFDGVTASFRQAQFRLDRGFGSARAATYAGSVQLESPGQPRIELPGKLWQADIAAGDLPDEASPYRLNSSDEWDRNYLSSVVSLNKELSLLAKGFERQVGGSRPTLDYFSSISEGQNIGFLSDYLGRKTADLFVAFTIASNSAGVGFRHSWEEAFSLYDEGAEWGVAAAIMNVPGHPLLAQLEELIRGTGVVASGRNDGETTFAFGGEGTSGSGDSGTGPGDSGSGNGSVNGGVGGETNDQVKDCATFADCTVQDVQDQLPPGPNDGDPDPDPGITPPGNLSGGGSGGGGGGGDLTDGLLDGGGLPNLP